MITIDNLNTIKQKYGLIEMETIAANKIKTYFINHADLDAGDYIFFYDNQFGYILLWCNDVETHGKLYDDIVKFEIGLINELKARKIIQADKRKIELGKDFEL